MDEELEAAVGRSGADQLSSQLVDLADVLGNFRDRLIDRGVPEEQGNEMVSQWFMAYLWSEQGCPDEE